MATKEEKEKAATEKAAKEAEEKRIADEKAEEEKLKADSERIAAERVAEAAAKKKAREEAEKAGEGEKMYSRAEVLNLIKKAVADQVNGVVDDGLDEEDPYAQKQLRLPRFMNKFIFGFKNSNTDEYFPDQIIYAFDQFNPQTRQNIPHVTIVFDDDSTLIVPLETVLKKSQKVLCDIVEVIETDKSYSSGKTERAEVKDYSRTGTGVMVKMKVTQAIYKYKIRLPGGNKEVIVGPEVVNW